MSLASQTIVEAAALLVGLVLLIAGMPKAFASAVFAGQIADYGIVPQFATQYLARIISSSELLAGVMLIVGLPVSLPLRQAGAGLAALLFMLFLVALASAWGRGQKIACACFGGDSELETVGVHSLVRTALLLVLAVVAIIPVHGAHPLEVLGVAAILAAFVAAASELARLLGPLRRETRIILEQLSATVAVTDQTEVTR
jgi:hypothetical protein